MPQPIRRWPDIDCRHRILRRQCMAVAVHTMPVIATCTGDIAVSLAIGCFGPHDREALGVWAAAFPGHAGAATIAAALERRGLEQVGAFVVDAAGPATAALRATFPDALCLPSTRGLVDRCRALRPDGMRGEWDAAHAEPMRSPASPAEEVIACLLRGRAAQQDSALEAALRQALAQWRGLHDESPRLQRAVRVADQAMQEACSDLLRAPPPAAGYADAQAVADRVAARLHVLERALKPRPPPWTDETRPATMRPTKLPQPMPG